MKTLNLRLIKILIIQILTRYGWESCEEHAISLFAEMVIKYIKYIGLLSKRSSELADKREVAIFDVFNVLKKVKVDLEKLREFMSLANAEMNYFPLARELYFQLHNKYNEVIVNKNPKNPSLPTFFRKKKYMIKDKSHINPTGIKLKDEMYGSKFDFLPGFPETYTFLETKVNPTKELQEAEVKKNRAKGKRSLEAAVTQIKEEDANNKDKGEKVKHEPIDHDSFDGNPFQAPVKKLHILEEKEIQANEFL